jgi:hypothetical protein
MLDSMTLSNRPNRRLKAVSVIHAENVTAKTYTACTTNNRHPASRRTCRKGSDVGDDDPPTTIGESFSSLMVDAIAVSRSVICVSRGFFPQQRGKIQEGNDEKSSSKPSAAAQPSCRI